VSLNIAVLGSGTIGQSWCALFLAAGYQVTAYDPNPSRELEIRAFVSNSEAPLRALGYSNAGSLTDFCFTTDVVKAVEGAQVVQESAPENLALKTQLYRLIEPVLDPKSTVLSSTSGITLEMLQACFFDPSRILIAHPFNPPHLIPLVEVLGNESTAPDLIQWTLSFYEGLGKVPIELKKSIPGHIANRLQAVLWQEVLHLAKEGVASLSDIDRAIVNGPGLRWAIYGPNQLFSLAAGADGLEGFIDHLGPSFQDWWSAAGHVELDTDTRQFIKRNYPSVDENERRAIQAYRDHLICRILNEKKSENRVLPGDHLNPPS
tara:strand:+ start:295 stop:1251 length:957 start_codon:yes stop_codon:yes gene_type:complete